MRWEREAQASCFSDMELEPQQQEFVYSAGQLQNVEDNVTQEQFTSIRNMEYRKEGGLIRRGGFASQGSATYDIQHELVSDRKRMVLVNGSSVDALNNQSRLWFYRPEYYKGPRSYDKIHSGDVAWYRSGSTGDEYVCFVYLVPSGAAYYEIRNISDRASVYAHGVLASGSTFDLVRVVQQKDNFICFLSDKTNNTLYSIYINMVSFSVGTPAAVTTNLDGTLGMFAVDSHPDGRSQGGTNPDSCYVLFKRQSDGLLSCIRTNENGVTQSTFVHGSVTPGGLWFDIRVQFITGSTYEVLEVYETGAGGIVRMITQPTGLSTVDHGPTTVLSAAGTYTYFGVCAAKLGLGDQGYAGVVAYDVGVGGVRHAAIRFDHGSVTSTLLVKNTILMAPPWGMELAGDWRLFALLQHKPEAPYLPHAFVAMLPNSQTTFQFHLANAAMVGTAAVDTPLVTDWTSGLTSLRVGNVEVDSNAALGEFRVLMPLVTSIESDVTGTINSAYDLFSVDWHNPTEPNPKSTQPFPKCVIGDACYVAGPVLRSWDGEIYGEVVPPVKQAMPTLTEVNLGSGLLVNGTYSYVCVPEYIDSFGKLHRGVPSTPASVTVGSGPSSVKVDLEDYMPSSYFSYPTDSKARRWRLAIYRLVSGTYHLIQRVVMTNGTGTTYTDNTVDATVQNNEVLYTTGGVLANEPPPTMLAITADERRIMGISRQEPTKIVYSKELQEGIAPEFNAALSFFVDEPAKAVASLDDRWIIFGEYNTYAVVGDGANATGFGGFSPPERIVEGVGCTNPLSVVNIPQGIVFQHNEKLYLLGRDFGVVDLTDAIEDETAATLRAVHHSNQRRVYFVGLNTNLIHVLDYSFGDIRFYTWTHSDTAFFVEFLDAAIRNDTLFLLGRNSVSGGKAQLYTVDATVDTDTAGNAAQVVGQYTTGWFKGAGHFGGQRIWNVRLLGEQGHADNTVSASYSIQQRNLSSSSFVSETHEWSNTTLSLDKPSVLRVSPKHQRCSAFRLTVTTRGGVPGVVFHGHRIDYGIRPAHKGRRREAPGQ